MSAPYIKIFYKNIIGAENASKNSSKISLCAYILMKQSGTEFYFSFPCKCIQVHICAAELGVCFKHIQKHQEWYTGEIDTKL